MESLLPGFSVRTSQPGGDASQAGRRPAACSWSYVKRPQGQNSAFKSKYMYLVEKRN
jgi:hypothetical protein